MDAPQGAHTPFPSPRAIRSMVEKWVPSLPYVSTFMARVGQIVGGLRLVRAITY